MFFSSDLAVSSSIFVGAEREENLIRNDPDKSEFTTSDIIKAGPLEAILVIFGRRALIFFWFESSWKNMKNDATFVRMRSDDHLGDAKCRKRAPRSVEFKFFINCDRNGFRRMREEGQIYKILPQIFKFLPRDLVLTFQKSVMTLPVSSTSKDHN